MRLIDADALCDKIESFFNGLAHAWGQDKADYWACNICTIVDDAPTIDADPVRHGRWSVEIDTASEMYVCSSCKCRMIKNDYDRATGTRAKNFCPYCGAKMDNTEGEK